MKKNVLFIFCHQDDEMGVFNHIENSIKLNLNVFVLFLTSGSINKKIDKNKLYHRDLESLSVLKNLGVKNKNIKFIGRKLGINVYELHKNYLAAYKELSKQINYIKGNIEIITHSWEGGNTDHDSCYLLVKKLYINNNKIKSCFQFSLYHSKNMPFNFYKVLDPITENGKIIKYSININRRLDLVSIS
jgi:LmbE family N-acetylglucosaminyl deacetylase